jgi:hypothetical protein
MHAGTSLVILAARAGNSPEVSWEHFACEFDRSRTTKLVPPEAALRAARRAVAPSGATTAPRSDDVVALARRREKHERPAKASLSVSTRGRIRTCHLWLRRAIVQGFSGKMGEGGIHLSRAFVLSRGRDGPVGCSKNVRRHSVGAAAAALRSPPDPEGVLPRSSDGAVARPRRRLASRQPARRRDR